MAARALGTRYSAWMKRSPYGANIAQACTLMTTGDVIAQHVEINAALDSPSFDPTRTAVLAAFMPVSTLFYLWFWKVRAAARAAALAVT